MTVHNHSNAASAKEWADAFRRETEELRIAQQRIVTIEAEMQGPVTSASRRSLARARLTLDKARKKLEVRKSEAKGFRTRVRLKAPLPLEASSPQVRTVPHIQASQREMEDDPSDDSTMDELQALRYELFRELEQYAMRDRTRQCSQCGRGGESRIGPREETPAWRRYLDEDSNCEGARRSSRDEGDTEVSGCESSEQDDANRTWDVDGSDGRRVSATRPDERGRPQSAVFPQSVGRVRGIPRASSAGVRIRPGGEAQVTERQEASNHHFRCVLAGRRHDTDLPTMTTCSGEEDLSPLMMDDVLL
ncbi:hypothetical protein FOZ60_007054 [Perkinsus olseni]|uniref:Uncharacterized protein n=1 Tax=Perkinsus olseni TaxID=32597 RepID=A0A7J6NM98_PEROL|nr:hypothetical protein FOZ60_007054 [Perkinsus olseni]